MRKIFILHFFLFIMFPLTLMAQDSQRKTRMIHYVDIGDELAVILDYCIQSMNINVQKDILEVILRDINHTNFARTYVGINRAIVRKPSVKDALYLNHNAGIIGYGERKGVVFVIRSLQEENLNNCPFLIIDNPNKQKKKLIELDPIPLIPPIEESTGTIAFEIAFGKIYKYE